jgi:polysaccharide pyruvyl transferase CsaB
VKFALSGYWGAGNLGDESILAGTLAALRKRGVEAAVLSANPSETKAQHGVAAYHRYSPKQMRQALKSAALLIGGGGGLLQDATSFRSLLYYLFVLRWARRAGVPTMIFAQGIGPLKRRLARILVRREANAARCITVRDQASRELLESIGVQRDIEVTADASFLLDPAVDSDAARIGEKIGTLRRPLLGVALRPWGDMAWLREVSDALGHASRTLGGTLVFLAFDRGQDRALSAQMAEDLGGRAFVLSPESPQEMLAIFGYLDMALAMRLHAAIFAVLTGVPAAVLSYDPKCDSFCREAGLPDALSVGCLSSKRLVEDVIECWESRAERAATARSAAAAMRSRAQRNVEAALGSGSQAF